MSPAEILARAATAKRILDEPLVIEAFEVIERDVIEAYVACPTRDLEGMRLLQNELRRARKFKGVLQAAIEQGKLTAHDLREKESFAQMALKKVRQ